MRQPAACDNCAHIGLAPCLGTTSSARVDADTRDDGNPRTWAPVRLSTEGVAFRFTDETAETEIHGPYQVEIRDGLTRAMKADEHVVTLYQGRWSGSDDHNPTRTTAIRLGQLRLQPASDAGNPTRTTAIRLGRLYPDSDDGDDFAIRLGRLRSG